VEADLRLANRMIARMGPSVGAAVLGRAASVARALKQLSLSATLVSPVDGVPWEALGHLFATLEGLPGVKLARATKILHKKRPALIPILDDVVVRYLELVDATGPPPWRRDLSTFRLAGNKGLSTFPDGSLAARGLTLTQAYHAELQAALPVLTCVRNQLVLRDLDLTECFLDIYLWAYSRTYEPLWRRREQRGPGAARQPGSPERPGRPGPDRPPLGGSAPPAAPRAIVERFWRDDAGYLAWLASYPDGFVLNCDYRPKAGYLKLHRAGCGHLHRKGVQNWTEPYLKVCSASTAHLDEWARRQTTATPDRCSCMAALR
jgi:hypothetical protein